MVDTKSLMQYEIPKTASMALTSVSSSFATVAAYAQSVSETASYANRASSASYADYANNVPVTASYANHSLSSSYVLSASYAGNVPVTASYANRALSASYANNVPETASYSTRTLSSSYAFSASYASNVPVTASYANRALSSSYASNVPETASYANRALSASYANNVPETASYATIALSSSYTQTASYVSGISETSSYAIQALSASYVSGVSETSSYAIRALTASYASNASETASYANQATLAETASYEYFNGNRSIKRSGYSGLNVGGMNVATFLNNFFFPFISATIAVSPSGTSYYQQGTNPNFTVTATITANDETIFGSGSMKKDGSAWNSASVPPLSFAFTDANITSNHSYYATVSVDNNGSPTTITSNTSNVSFIYPYLWGTSSVAGLSGASLWSTMSRQVVTSGNKTVNFVGSVVFMYFAYPATYPALTSILDPNGFEVIGNYEYTSSVSVTSVGLYSDWTTNYRVYRTRIVSDPNGNYQFKQ
jgi:hypothetical protein